MSVKYTNVEFGSPTHNILATNTHFVPFHHTVAKATAAGGIVVAKEGRLVVEAGTIYPANDDTAQGIVLNEVDVTDGDAQIAVVLHGFVLTEKLPEEPTDAARNALPMIAFLNEDGYIPFPVNGADGADGAPGADGADGLTTKIMLNGVEYEQVDGVITLPNLEPAV